MVEEVFKDPLARGRRDWSESKGKEEADTASIEKEEGSGRAGDTIGGWEGAYGIGGTGAYGSADDEEDCTTEGSFRSN